MPSRKIPINEPIPDDAVCDCCHRKRAKLQRCCLTGSGDHPRKFILCDDCVRLMFTRLPTAHSTPPSPAMTELEKRRETRRQNAFERLGTDTPICACCGETDWVVMEAHHLEGEDFGETLLVVCRNCHRKLSDSQRDQPGKIDHLPSKLEWVAHLLAGVADALILIAKALRDAATCLFEEARRRGPKTKGTLA